MTGAFQRLFVFRGLNTVIVALSSVFTVFLSLSAT